MGWDGPMSNKEFLGWQSWLDMQWNNPGRIEWYIMRAIAELISPHLKKGKRVKPEDYKIEFTLGGNRGRKKLTKEQAAQISKGAWIGMMTKDVVEVDQEGNTVRTIPITKSKKKARPDIPSKLKETPRVSDKRTLRAREANLD